MKNRSLPLVASLCLASVLSAPAASFTGDLSAWSAGGDVRVSGGSATLTNAYDADVDDFPLEAGALNLSGNSPLAAGGDLETFSGLTVGALDLDAFSQATEGSAIKSTFTVAAGDKLSFDWQFSTREDAGGLDYAYLSIDGILIVLGGSAEAAEAALEPYFGQTPVSNYEYTFAAGGEVTVAFGIVDVGDYANTSSLALSNVTLTAVPEPATAGLAAAACLLGLLKRRRRA